MDEVIVSGMGQVCRVNVPELANCLTSHTRITQTAPSVEAAVTSTE